MTTHNIKACLAFLGYPQNEYQTVHVGGTNGKGSTSYFLHQMLMQHLRVGMYVSPYFMKRFDNIWIQGKPFIDAQKFYRIYKETFESFHLTPFEEETALAFILFKLNKVDIAIIEVGLGGINDATNVIQSDIAIITSCSLEHEELIGPTLKDIATHQAGIISNQKQKIILSNHLPKNALDVFIRQINHVGAQQIPVIPYPIELKPRYQNVNAALAFTAYQEFINSIELQKPLHYLPFRFEIYRQLIFDGAHNEEGMKQVVLSLKDLGMKPVVVMSTLETKHTNKMIEVLSEVASSLYITTFDHPHAISENVIKTLTKASYMKNTDVINMLKSPRRDIILITGSLYFIRYIKEKLNEKNRHI